MDLVSILSGFLVILITGLTFQFKGISTKNSTIDTQLINTNNNVSFLSQNVFALINGTNTNGSTTIFGNDIGIITVTPANVINNSSNITVIENSNSTNGTSNTDVNNTINVSNISTSTSYPNINYDPFASQVSLHLSYNNQFICGGTIIDSKFVVTVAHRMYYNWGGILPPIILTVSAGRRSLDDNNYKEYEVKTITFHDKFNESTLEFSLALIETKQTITLGKQINKVIFGESQIKYKSCTVTGWNKVSKKLEAINVDIIDCNKVEATNGVLCAHTKLLNETLCNYSEGSSLICNDELIGILSSEPSCGATNQTAIFQNLLKSTKWLTQSGINDIRISSGTRQYFMNLFSIILIICIRLI